MALEKEMLAQIDLGEPTSSKQTQELVIAKLLSDAIMHISPLLALAALWFAVSRVNSSRRAVYPIHTLGLSESLEGLCIIIPHHFLEVRVLLTLTKPIFLRW